MLCPCFLTNKQSLKCGLLVQLSTIEVPTAISGLPAERSRLKNHKAKLHPEFTPSLWCRPLLLSGGGGIIIIIRLLFNWTREQHATHQVAPNTSAHSPNNIVCYQGSRCKRRMKTFEVDSVQLANQVAPNTHSPKKGIKLWRGKLLISFGILFRFRRFRSNNEQCPLLCDMLSYWRELGLIHDIPFSGSILSGIQELNGRRMSH